MKFLVICLLSSFASASPQDAAHEIEQALAEVLAELEAVTQETSQTSHELAESQIELIGLKIAEGALNAVSEMVPVVTETATAALIEATNSIYATDRVLIGITGAPPSAALCSHLGIDATRTIIVNSIGPGMSAEKAGLREHDIITSIDGHPEATMDVLRDILATREVGDVVHLSIVSRGEQREILVPILDAQAWHDNSASAFGGIWAGLDESRSRYALQGILSQLANTQVQSQGFQAEMEEAQAEIARAAVEIELARAEYDRARVQLDSAAREKPNAEEALEYRLEALGHYESLLAEEASQLQSMRVMQDQERNLREIFNNHAKATRELARARFVKGTLVMPDPSSADSQAPNDNGRIGHVEQRVDELHQRFDRLEEMLERLASHRDN